MLGWHTPKTSLKMKAVAKAHQLLGVALVAGPRGTTAGSPAARVPTASLGHSEGVRAWTKVPS
jgi:hypothetical protein